MGTWFRRSVLLSLVTRRGAYSRRCGAARSAGGDGGGRGRAVRGSGAARARLAGDRRRCYRCGTGRWGGRAGSAAEKRGGIGCELYRGRVLGDFDTGPEVISSGMGELLLRAARCEAAVGVGCMGGGRWAPRGVGDGREARSPCGEARSLRGGAARAMPGVGGAAPGLVPPLRLRSDRAEPPRAAGNGAVLIRTANCPQ